MIIPIKKFKDSKLTRKTLANMIGVTPQTIWNWSNNGMPSFKYKGGTYYLLEETLNWMFTKPKHLELWCKVKIELDK